MLTRPTLIGSLVLILLPASVGASMVYVVTGNQQFGTVDLATGAFQQIGPDTPEGSSGLVPGPNGSLLTLTFAGNLDSINPSTGIITKIGPTGLADCTVGDGKCGPTSANALAEVGGKLYATDFSNNLYSVNPATGAAHLIGPTGLPPLPAGFPNFPDVGNPSVFDESLYGVGGKLYTTFDAFTFDPATGKPVTTVVPSFLYQIDPLTGKTIRVAPTLAFTATVDVNGTFYGFGGNTNQVYTLDLTNGNTRIVANIDQAVFLVGGASPVVPEPASVGLAGVGIAGMAVLASRRALSRRRSSAPGSGRNNSEPTVEAKHILRRIARNFR